MVTSEDYNRHYPSKSGVKVIPQLDDHMQPSARYTYIDTRHSPDCIRIVVEENFSFVQVGKPINNM